MKTLKLDLDTAKTLYKDASKEFKTLLEENFGKRNLIDDVTEIITCMEDVYEHLGICEKKALPYSNPIDKFQRRLNNIAKLQLVAKCYNEDWVPDYNNSNEYKHYPYFNKSSGSWSVDYCHFVDCLSVGSLVVFKTKELALKAGNNFLNIYKDIIENQ